VWRAGRRVWRDLESIMGFGDWEGVVEVGDEEDIMASDAVVETAEVGAVVCSRGMRG
jgi:hypothetical protein